MSSHHIVRNEQEPALLLVNNNLDTNILFELLEWSPTVMIMENVLEYTLLLGIKIDVLFCSIGKNTIYQQTLQHQQPVTILPVADYNLSNVYSYLENTNHNGINIIGEPYNIDVIWREAAKYKSIQTVYYRDNSASYAIKNIFKKWFTKHTIFKVNMDRDLNINNTLYNASDNTYTVLSDGFIEIDCGSNQFLFEEIW